MTRRISLVSVVMTAALAGPASGSVIDLTWIGSDGGLWHASSHWNPSIIPNNAGGFEYHAIVDTRFGNMVNLGTSATISGLTIGTNDHLVILNSRSLTLAAPAKSSGVVHNAGLIDLDSIGSATNLHVSNGPVNLTGGGTVRLGNNLGNRMYRSGTTGSLVNVDNVIEGAGHLGWSSVPTAITNHHLIIANQSLPLNLHANNTLLANTGEMRAESGGTLQINAGMYDNTGGVIEARAGSSVSLDGSASITGGMLLSVGNGVFNVTANTPRLIDLTHAAHTVIQNSRTLHLVGEIENTGMIELASTGSSTLLQVAEGPVTLTGGGTIRMGNNSGNRMYRTGASGSIVNIDNVIEGAGSLGWSSVPTAITNHHVIVANQPVTLDVHANNTLLTNTGQMLAEDGGTLQLNAGDYANTGGLIEARQGSTVSFSGNAWITGGMLSSEGDGVFVVSGNTPRLINLSHAAHTIIPNNRSLHVQGNIHNTGLIELGSTGSSTYLQVTEGPVSFTGGGTIRLGDNTSNWFYRSGTAGSIVNVDNVIEGAGNLGWTSVPTDLTNQHLIIANATNPMTIYANNALMINEGELRAESGATLRLAGGTYDNTGGLIVARDGSDVEFNGSAIITGGTIATEGDGLITVTSNTPRIADLTIDGHIAIANNRVLQASGVIHNTGLIELQSSGSSTYFRPTEGALTLTGGGTIQMSDNVNNWMYRDGVGHFVNMDNTIRGAGHIGWTSVRTGLINHGSIVANGTGLLQIAPDTEIGFVNHGSVHVQGAGGMAIVGGNMEQQGTLAIDADRTLTRSAGHYVQTAGTTTVNGALAVTGGGNQLRLQGGVLNGAGQINGVLNNTGGDIQPGLSTGLLTVNGSYLQSGAGVLSIEIDGEEPVDEHDVIDVNGAAQLGGYLQPVFGEKYEPQVGDSWEILTANSVSGRFSAVLPCQAIRVNYLNDSVVIEYTGVLRVGDLNCDGFVDVSDLLLLFSGWGTCVNEDMCPADLNGDGAVDVSDLLILFSNWG